MTREDHAFGEALGSSRADVVLMQNLEHGRAGQPHDQASREQSERDARQDQVLPGARPERGQQLEVVREDEDRQQAREEGRDRDTSSAVDLEPRSSHESLRTADTIPSGTPIRTVKRSATTASWRVRGSASAMSAVTSRPR